MPENNQKSTPWKVFVWVIGILTFLIITLSGIFQNGLASLNGQVGNVERDMGDIKGDIREMKTDIKWMRASLDNTLKTK